MINFATYTNLNLPNVVNATTPYTGAGGPGNTPTSSLQALWDIEDSLSWTKGPIRIGKLPCLQRELRTGLRKVTISY